MKRFFLGLMMVTFLATLVWVWPVLAFWSGENSGWSLENTSKAKKVALNDDGMIVETLSRGTTIQDFIHEQHIRLQPNDEITPPQEAPLFTGTTITIRRSKVLAVKIDQETKHLHTFERTIENALLDQGIILDEDDFTIPERESIVPNGATVSVVKVKAEEQIVDKSIAFEKVIKEDSELSWRKQRVEQKGELGNKRLTYKVLTHNGKEVSRKLLSQEVTKEPVKEIMVQGTYVKTGKAHTGLGTWYAHTGTLAAASPWLPMGSYAKVTNQENGKTVIVKINDRGPFGKNRIIDLDKVAFAKIASIGAGIINVKVEEIAN